MGARFWVGISLCTVFISCVNTPNKREILSVLETMKGTNVVFPNTLRSYSVNDYEIENGEINRQKIVVYFSPMVCTPCNLDRLFDMEELEEKWTNVEVVYILSYIKDEDEMEIKSYLEEWDFKSTVYLDKGNRFAKENPVLPRNPNYHTFLLDSEGKILIVGNPMLSTDVRNLYENLIND